ncbi:MAG: hypothetical protein AUI33_08565 [Ignavibacteria bacterium 13_1_40CM_2_61_4]|nr:MAG: hypothetical protein AUI33_08565 [Ignavibacteria bacterium 13_1_40CM_2_61_4]
MKMKKGDLLLKIKPDIYIAERDRAVAMRTSSKASLDRSAAEFKRARDMSAKGLISNSELEQATTAYEVAKATHAQSDAALKQADESLRKTTIYSPMDGTVSGLKVELGQRVLGTSQFQGTEVMTVADLSRMEARVDVGENDIISISARDTARIEVDAIPDRKLIGIVYQIGNSAKTKGLGTQEEVTNFEVRLRIHDKDVILRPGMSMTATIETETKPNVLAVPIQSVTTRSQNKDKEKKEAPEPDEMAANDAKIKQKNEKPKEVVFLVDNNAAKMVEVKRGISDDSYTEIVSGLQEGKEVVSGSYKSINRELEDGVKVKVDNTKNKNAKTASK